MVGSNSKPWRPPPARPARLGPYRLLAEIARGGIGAVYVGCADRPPGFRKIVAIKTLRPDLAAEPALVRMLVEEAQLASRLHHPHIAQLYDLGDDGGPFLIMEYVHGESLAAVLAPGALPPRLAVWIAAQICDALAYAHALRDERGAELGLVHRDVSPQNILIDYHGVPRLLDFGIARARHRAADTDRGAIKGRFAYMAPEQRSGRPVDGRADLHALGVVLYQATVGAHPWDLAGGDADRIPDPRPHRPGFADALWAVIERATAADPAQRFAAAGDMLAALRAVASGLGPPVDRGEVAALLAGAFAARRAAKQELLGGLRVDGDTEVLAPIAAAASDASQRLDSGPGVGEPEPPRQDRRSPRRWFRPSWRSALLVAVVMLPGLAVSRSWLQRPAASGALQRPCLLVDASGTLADRDAAWLAVRLIGLALDRNPSLQVMHGYRVQDREGWSAAGRAVAERACLESGSDGVVAVSARPDDGRARVTRNGQLVTKQIEPGLAGVARLAERLVTRWTPEPAGALPWRAVLPDWPDGSLRALLDMRDGLVLQRPSDRVDRQPFEALARENPQLELVPLVEAISRWWNGDLDDPAARAALLPPGASQHLEVLVAAIADLVAGREALADAAVARLLEDPRWAADAITLYIAGEARVHAGRPAEGTRLLERALAIDPQLSPAIYHVAERRLAEGDWDSVERMAVLWDRIEPGSPRAIELRGAIMLGTGRYADASRLFESLLDRSRSDSTGLHLPRAAVIYARLFAGDTAGALARARLASSRMNDHPAITAVLPDPIVYGWALGRGDQALAREWEARLRQRLADKTRSASYWQLAYSLAILDHLAGMTDARARWVGAGPSVSVSRRYRFAAHARILAVLEADATGDRSALAEAARDDRDLLAFHLARALVAQRRGGPADAVAELESAMAASPGGDFDCVAAALLVRAQQAAGDAAGAIATCRRITAPRVPRPYCLVARGDCLAVSTPP